MSIKGTKNKNILIVGVTGAVALVFVYLMQYEFTNLINCGFSGEYRESVGKCLYDDEEGRPYCQIQGNQFTGCGYCTESDDPEKCIDLCCMNPAGLDLDI